MAYKPIDERFWKDKKVKRLSKDGYLLFLYLLTSPHTHFSGMSEMTLDYVNIDTPMTPQESKAAFKELIALGIVEYDEANEIVWIRNMHKYQVKSDQQRKGAQNHLNALPRSEICRKLATLLGLDYKHPVDTVLQTENTLPIPYHEVENTLPIQEEAKEEAKEEVKANVKAEVKKEEKANRLMCLLEDVSQNSARKKSQSMFEEFWQAYPKKTGKKKVAGIYERLIAREEVTHDELIRGVNAYKRSDTVNRGFIKNPETWLNGGCWADEYEENDEESEWWGNDEVEQQIEDQLWIDDPVGMQRQRDAAMEAAAIAKKMAEEKKEQAKKAQEALK